MGPNPAPLPLPSVRSFSWVWACSFVWLAPWVRSESAAQNVLLGPASFGTGLGAVGDHPWGWGGGFASVG